MIGACLGAVFTMPESTVVASQLTWGPGGTVQKFLALHPFQDPMCSYGDFLLGFAG